MVGRSLGASLSHGFLEAVKGRIAFFLPPKLPSDAGCRGTPAPWAGMAGGYGLGAGPGVELVKSWGSS